MNTKITQPELIELLSKKCDCTKREAEQFLKEFFALAADTVAQGENLKINGLGQFRSIWVEPRASVNVRTGEPMEIAGHYKLSFAPDKAMREAVNAPFSCFIPEVLPDDAIIDDISTVDNDNTDDTEKDEIIDTATQPESTSQKELTLVEAPLPAPENVPQEETPQPVSEEENTSEKEIYTTETASATTTEEVTNEAVDENTPPLTETQLDELADFVLQELIANAQTEAEMSATPNEETPTDTTEPTPTDSPSKEPQPEIINLPETGDTDSADIPSEVVFLVDEETLWQKICRRPILSTICAITLAAVVFIGVTLYRSPEWRAQYAEIWSERIAALVTASDDSPRQTSADLTTDAQAPTQNEIPAPAENAKAEQLHATNTGRENNSVEKIVPVEKSSPEPTEQTVTPRPDVTTLPPIATVKLERGKRLTLLALEYYGDKVFWVYIYEENRNRISNPNNIPIGFSLNIPDARKYGIDANDKASIDRANKLADELKKRYK
ncbi:MAG: HU family DNA-binding protein [Coprobacter sp.]|nr:HU family DNA-binding protein [Coprobacter sp.]